MDYGRWKMNNGGRAQRGPFPLNVARTISTTRVTRMKSMRNLAMVGQMTEIGGQTTDKTEE
jgi:hypothetical protein